MTWASSSFLAAGLVVTLPVAGEIMGQPDTVSAETSYTAATFLRDQKVSGVIRSDYLHSSKNLDNDTGFFGTTVQLKALPSASEFLDGKLELRITSPAIGDDAQTRSQLLEGYATLHFSSADCRIGKQIIAWGRADGINPTDNLTPRDFTVQLPFDNDQRLGTTAVKLDLFLSQQLGLSLFATPYFKPSIIPPLPASYSVIETSPAASLANTEVGVKLNNIGESLDWSISYFRGFSLLPDLRLIGSTPTGPVVILHYDRITVLGADFARNYGRYGLRGELAYVDTTDDAGTDIGIKNPYLFWVVGIDRTFFDNLNINVQLLQRHIRHYLDPETVTDPLARDMAIQNAARDGQSHRRSSGISFRISNRWFNNTLEAEVFSVLNLARHDRLVRPLLNYALNDQWKGTLGAEWYSGPDNTPYGNLKQNSGAFAELRYSF